MHRRVRIAATQIAASVGLLSLILAPQTAFAACPAVPSWADGRNGACQLEVAAGNGWGVVTFQDEQAGGERDRVGTHGTRDANHVWHDLRADGYEGRPPGSCTRPGECGMENIDVGHVWGSRNERIVLIKNVEIKNAFKTTRTASIKPHVDTLQGYQAGLSSSDPQWLVIQDTLLRNSDDQILLLGNMKSAGVLLQNLVVEQEAWFDDDCSARNDTYEIKDPWCAATNGIGSTIPDIPLWMVNVRFINTKSFSVDLGVHPLILIDTPDSEWYFRKGNAKPARVYRYDSIEEALADRSCADCPHVPPPFVELSCTGWASPPAGCVDRLGPNGSTPPADGAGSGSSGGGSSGGGSTGGGGSSSGGGGTAELAVSRLVLYDADRDTPIFDPWNGETIDLRAYPNVSIEAIVNGGPGSVLFTLDGSPVRTENGTPYAIGGDAGPGAYEPWTSVPQEGNHRLRATPFSAANASGQAGTSKTVTFNVNGEVQLGRPGRPQLLR